MSTAGVDPEPKGRKLGKLGYLDEKSVAKFDPKNNPYLKSESKKSEAKSKTKATESSKPVARLSSTRSMQSDSSPTATRSSTKTESKPKSTPKHTAKAAEKPSGAPKITPLKSQSSSKFGLGDFARATGDELKTAAGEVPRIAKEVGTAASMMAGPEMVAGSRAAGAASKAISRFPKAGEALGGLAEKAKGAVEGISKKLFPSGEDAIKNPKLRSAIKAQKSSPASKGAPGDQAKLYGQNKGPMRGTSSDLKKTAGKAPKTSASRVNTKAVSSKSKSSFPKAETTPSKPQAKGSTKKVNKSAKDSYVGIRKGKAQNKAEIKEAQSDWESELKKQSSPKRKGFNRDGSHKSQAGARRSPRKPRDGS